MSFAMDAKLVVVGGDVKATEVKLKLPAVIGRGREATLTLPHPLVSRKHCEIFESNGYLVVRDMGSLNGTFVNNERITETVLPPGDLLTLGTVTFRAVYEPPVGEPAEPIGAQSDAQEFEIGLAPDDGPLEVEEVVEVVEVAEEGEVADFGDFEIVEVDDDDQPTGVSDLDTLEPE
jgi:pSer/pThr/pTyr-binding forkhead associated (FHA) protein